MNNNIKHYSIQGIKIIGKFLLGIAAFLLLYLLCTFVLSRITVNSNVSEESDLNIYIKSNGVHTDIVMPISNEVYDWSTQVKFEHTKSKSTEFSHVAVGWGDKGFYLETPTWAELKFSTAFKAAFGMSTSAMHTTFYKNLKTNKDCKRIGISFDEYQKLIDFILESFAQNEYGDFDLVGTEVRYGEHDAFYEGNGKYNLFYTCNTWANTCLKKAGRKACLWTAFEDPIFQKYR